MNIGVAFKAASEPYTQQVAVFSFQQSGPVGSLKAARGKERFYASHMGIFVDLSVRKQLLQFGKCHGVFLPYVLLFASLMA